MKRLEKRESWSLFDPYIVEKIMGYKLEDYFDDEDRKEFTNKYLECERNTNIPRDTVPTLDIMKN